MCSKGGAGFGVREVGYGVREVWEWSKGGVGV